MPLFYFRLWDAGIYMVWSINGLEKNLMRFYIHRMLRLERLKGLDRWVGLDRQSPLNHIDDPIHKGDHLARCRSFRYPC